MEKRLFKAGDRVKLMQMNNDYPITLHKIYTVVCVQEGVTTTQILYIKMDNGVIDWLCDSRFELVVQDDLESLISDANKFQAAFAKLYSEHAGEYECSEKGANRWSIGKYSPTSEMEYRLLPKSKKFRWLAYDCSEENGLIKIGCQEFKTQTLCSQLSSILEGQSAGFGDIVVSRNGVSYKGNQFSWTELESLKNLLQSNVGGLV